MAGKAAAVVLLMAALACGGSSKQTPTSPGGSAGAFTASIDGAAWQPVSVSTQTNSFQSALAVQGVDANGRTLRVTFPIGNGTGTQTIGSGNGGHAQLTIGPQIWVVTNVGWGTLTLSVAGSGRAAGTFDLTMHGADPSVVPIQRRVTGEFDVTF